MTNPRTTEDHYKKPDSTETSKSEGTDLSAYQNVAAYDEYEESDPNPDYVRRFLDQLAEGADVDPSDLVFDTTTIRDGRSLAPIFPDTLNLRQIIRPEDVGTRVFPRGEWEIGDFYPSLREVRPRNERRSASVRPFEAMFINDNGSHYNREKQNKTLHWILCLFDGNDVKDKKKFSYKQKHVRHVFGVAVHLGDGKRDCGEIRKAVKHAVANLSIPPFQLWIEDESTRYCYGVILLDKPIKLADAKRDWKYLQPLYFRRLGHIGVDTFATSITQPLPAPGRDADYYFTGCATTSFADLRHWYSAHRQADDLYEWATVEQPISLVDGERLEAAWKTIDKHTKRRRTTGKRREINAHWESSVRWAGQRASDIENYIKAMRRVPCEPSEILKEYAEAVKRYEYKREGNNDGKHAFREALRQTATLNELLDVNQQLTSDELYGVVMESDPTATSCTPNRRLVDDLEITYELAEKLDLKQLAPPELKVQRHVADVEHQAREKKRKHEEQEQAVREFLRIIAWSTWKLGGVCTLRMEQEQRKVVDRAWEEVQTTKRKERAKQRRESIDELLTIGLSTIDICEKLSVDGKEVRRRKQKHGNDVQQQRKRGRKKKIEDKSL